MAIQRFATEAEMRAVAGAHYWNDVGALLPWVALTGADAPQDTPTVMVCSPWQFRKYLNAHSLRSAVEAYVAAAPQDVKDGYEFANEFRTDDPLVLAAAAALKLDPVAVISEAATL